MYEETLTFKIFDSSSFASTFATKSAF